MTDNELLAALSKMIEPLNSDIKGIHTRLDKMDERFDKMDEQFGEMKEHVATMQTQLNAVDDRLSIVDKRTVQTQIFLENEISQKIELIGEGHDFLKQRLDNALTIEKAREAMGLKITNLQIEVKKINETLEEYKKELQKIS